MLSAQWFPTARLGQDPWQPLPPAFEALHRDCTSLGGSPAEKRSNSPAFANLMPQIFFWERSGQSWPSFGGCTRGGFLFPSLAVAARAGEGRPAQATSPEDNEPLLEGQAGVLAC